MIYSMTGFATTTVALETGTTAITATFTLKTLNNRFLDVSCKLPYAVTHLEPDIIKKCKQQLHRGSLYFSMYITNPQALKTNAVPSLAVAAGYLKGIKEIQQKLGLPGEISIANFITLPDLFATTEDLGSMSEQSDIIMHTVDQLLAAVLVARTAEGLALQKDLIERMRLIEEALAQIEPRIAVVGQERKHHFLHEISQAIANAPAEIKDTHIQALYNNLEKIDVNEEIVRFKNHHANFLHTVGNSEQQKGKKLDFILQEMLREINTLNAKVPDAQTSNPVITIKVELEKAREQVQNIV